MKYYYKNKKGNNVLCLDYPIEEDLRYNNTSVWQEATKSDYDNYVAKKNAEVEIARLEMELSLTDWVVVKIAEETDVNEITALRTKYASVIAERKSHRARINELEAII